MRLLLLIAAVSCALSGCGEDIEAHYPTYADLQKANAGARSWMPQWLPASATDIRDWHDLDTNATLIAFAVPEATPQLLRGCRPAKMARNPGTPSAWWPDNQAFMELEHFRCDERVTFADGRVETREAGAALDRTNHRIYFWRTGG